MMRKATANEINEALKLKEDEKKWLVKLHYLTLAGQLIIPPIGVTGLGIFLSWLLQRWFSFYDSVAIAVMVGAFLMLGPLVGMLWNERNYRQYVIQGHYIRFTTKGLVDGKAWYPYDHIEKMSIHTGSVFNVTLKDGSTNLVLRKSYHLKVEKMQEWLKAEGIEVTEF